MTRAQVRNLEERSALWVSKHLVMAGRLLDIDPEEAFQHALAASRRGGRLAAVREAVGVTAYAAGHYGEALREFRTFRRISGSNVHLPVMADCERGLGRPDRALDLARSEEAETLDAAGKAELAMVISGARADLGQFDAAVSALEIPQLDLNRAFAYSPRLFRAYADALDAAGRSSESERWRRQAIVADRALGVDEDEDPGIIDLGDDDDLPEESGRLPRATDVVPAHGRGTEEVAHNASEDVATREDADIQPAMTSSDADRPERMDATADADVEHAESSSGDATADVDAHVSAELSAEDDDADPSAEEAVDLFDDEDAPSVSAAHAPDNGRQPTAQPGSSSEERSGGERAATRASASALQTEALFSMDAPNHEDGVEGGPGTVGGDRTEDVDRAETDAGASGDGVSSEAGEAGGADVSRGPGSRASSRRVSSTDVPAGQDVIDE